MVSTPALLDKQAKVLRNTWGLLKETAKKLKEDYGWKYEEDSYTVRRFLDRAERIWHISTRYPTK